MVRQRLVRGMIAVLLGFTGLWGNDICAQTTEAAEPIVSQIRIEIRDAAGDSERWREVAQSLIFLKEGERFSAPKFQESIEALKSSRMFQEIDVPDPDWSRSRITLTFRLKPFARIKNIDISGGFPLLEKEILNVMTLYTGDAFVKSKLAQQEEYIEALFRDEGYIDPEVTITAEKDPKDGDYILHVNVAKGPYYRVETVRVEGNDGYSDPRLKFRLDTWQSSLLFDGPARFVQKELHDDLETLTEFYREHKYPEVKISPTVEKDRHNRTVDVTLNVDEGPRYDITFEGNREFWTFTLKKDLVLFQEGVADGFGLRKSIRNIEKRYRQAGYLDIRIDKQEETVQEDEQTVRNITLKIEEGPRSIVENLDISGNQAFDDEKIKEQMVTLPPGLIDDGEYVPEELEEDIRAVNALYLQEGYRQTRIESRVDRRRVDLPDEETDRILVDVRLSIEEGPQTLVSKIAINGLTVVPNPLARDALVMEPGTPYREYLLEEEQNRLASLVSEEGYPHVVVDRRVDIRNDRTRAAITYSVSEGPYVEMGKTFYTGNFRTRTRVFEREMELEPGEPFSLTRLLESQRRIRNINALESAQFQTFGLEGKADRVDLLVNVEEQKPYFLQFGLGYDTRRRFYVNTVAGDRNLFGLNKELWAGLELSQIGYRADLGLVEPRFFGTEISATADLFAEEIEEFNHNFGTRSYGAAVGFNRALFKNLTANLSLRYEFREQYRTDDSPIPPGDEDQYEPRSILVTTPSLVYNSTDSFTRPTRGIYSSLSVDISKGIENSLDDFFKYRLETRYYYTPVKKLTFAVRGRYGYIDPFGTDSTIPEDQRFFLGGTSDVRGFDENELRVDAEGDPVGGRTAVLGSLEARYDLGLNFELATFYDVGTIRDPLEDAGSDDFRSAVGLGLRYVTPIGPVGLMYGWKLDPMEGESSGELHFAIGYTF